MSAGAEPGGADGHTHAEATSGLMILVRIAIVFFVVPVLFALAARLFF